MESNLNTQAAPLHNWFAIGKYVLFGVGITLGIVTIILSDFELNNNFVGGIIFWVIVPTAIGILTALSFTYLQGSKIDKVAKDNTVAFDHLMGEISSIRKEIKSIHEEKEATNPLENKFNLKQINHHISALKTRFSNEIKRLILKSNISLSIGASTTLIAVFLLWYNILDVIPEFETLDESIAFLIPRLFIILIIEGFSLFFLRLYKTSLKEIKFYQNEITNVEFRAIALNSALAQNDEESLKRIINNLIQSEKNSGDFYTSYNY